MAEFPEAPEAPVPPGSSPAPHSRRSPLATHPVASLLIGLLLAASIAIPLIVPIYGRTQPRIGDFPFFYFFLLICMPAVALALWIVSLLQRRLPQ